MVTTALTITKCSLRQLVRSPEFKGKLYQLGMNARQKTESIFHVSIDPAIPKQFMLSEVVKGATAQIAGSALVPAPDEFYSGIERIVEIHNHPVVNSWDDFFSADDLKTSMGRASGLVFVPLGRSSLILLLAQIKEYSFDRDYEPLVESAYIQFVERLKLLIPKLPPGATEMAWMAAAVGGLNSVGISAAAKLYDFPQDCGADKFLINSKEQRAIQLAGEEGEFKKIDISLRRNQRISRQFNQEFGIFELPNLADLPNPPVMQIEGFPDQGVPPSGNESLYTYFHDNTSFDRGTAKELIKRLNHDGIIKNLHFWKYGGFSASPEDMGRIRAMSFYTLEDLAIKLETTTEDIIPWVVVGMIEPDYILNVEGKTVIVFTHLPRLPQLSKGGK